MVTAMDRAQRIVSFLPSATEMTCALGLGERFQRIFLTGGGAEVVRSLIPEYASAAVHMLEEGSLRGVARLFSPNQTISR